MDRALLALALVLAALIVNNGLRASACGPNPYLTFCGDWVSHVPR